MVSDCFPTSNVIAIEFVTAYQSLTWLLQASRGPTVLLLSLVGKLQQKQGGGPRPRSW